MIGSFKYLVNQLELNLAVDIAFQFVPLGRLGVSITCELFLALKKKSILTKYVETFLLSESLCH